jgi:hypothetical protein
VRVKLLCDEYFTSVVFFPRQFSIVMNGGGGVLLEQMLAGEGVVEPERT